MTFRIPYNHDTDFFDFTYDIISGNIDKLFIKQDKALNL